VRFSFMTTFGSVSFARACVLMIVLLALTLSFAKADATQTQPAVSKLEMDSDGKQIRVDRYAPFVGHDRHRNILVLYGAGGMLFDGARMRRVARALSANGYTVFLPHYFNRTGTIYARDPAMIKNFDTWTGTVRDAISWVNEQKQPGSGASSKIGVYGYSLGAFLALVAVSDNPRVGALAEQAGGIWNNEAGRIGHLPAVLIIHGEKDERVPFTKFCVSLQRTLTNRGVPFEKRIFPSEGHVFTPVAAAETAEDVAHFFDRVLR
jgi:dienelactone hydrolase